jgi:hypothetical protein
MTDLEKELAYYQETRRGLLAQLRAVEARIEELKAKARIEQRQTLGPQETKRTGDV